jgi:hypothetical protein
MKAKGEARVRNGLHFSGQKGRKRFDIQQFSLSVNLHIDMDSKGACYTKLYDKGDDFNVLQ